jgi:WD40 repeat protein
VLAAGISPDGTRGFAVARNVVTVFDLETGDRLTTGELPDHAKSGNWISDDRVALGCANGQVVILDASDGHEVGVISGHVNSVFEVVVSPDGRWLATAGEDRTVRLHDAVEYREIRLLGSHAARVRSVAFTPDGTGLISTGDDGRIRHWPLDYVARMRSVRERAAAARPVLADNASDAAARRDLTDWYATRGLYETALQQNREHSVPAGDSPADRLRRAALHWLAGDADGAFVRYSELMHDPDVPDDVRLHARLCARAVRR